MLELENAMEFFNKQTQQKYFYNLSMMMYRNYFLIDAIDFSMKILNLLINLLSGTILFYWK